MRVCRASFAADFLKGYSTINLVICNGLYSPWVLLLARDNLLYVAVNSFMRRRPVTGDRLKSLQKNRCKTNKKTARPHNLQNGKEDSWGCCCVTYVLGRHLRKEKKTFDKLSSSVITTPRNHFWSPLRKVKEFWKK